MIASFIGAVVLVLVGAVAGEVVQRRYPKIGIIVSFAADLVEKVLPKSS